MDLRALVLRLRPHGDRIRGVISPCIRWAALLRRPGTADPAGPISLSVAVVATMIRWVSSSTHAQGVD